MLIYMQHAPVNVEYRVNVKIRWFTHLYHVNLTATAAPSRKDGIWHAPYNTVEVAGYAVTTAGVLPVPGKYHMRAEVFDGAGTMVACGRVQGLRIDENGWEAVM